MVDERFRVGCVQVTDESCKVCGVWVVGKSSGDDGVQVVNESSRVRDVWV